jgi:hypothetical protein
MPRRRCYGVNIDTDRMSAGAVWAKSHEGAKRKVLKLLGRKPRTLTVGVTSGNQCVWFPLKRTLPEHLRWLASQKRG